MKKQHCSHCNDEHNIPESWLDQVVIRFHDTRTENEIIGVGDLSRYVWALIASTQWLRRIARVNDWCRERHHKLSVAHEAVVKLSAPPQPRLGADNDGLYIMLPPNDPRIAGLMLYMRQWHNKDGNDD